MASQTRTLSTQTSTLDRVVTASLAALAMFVVGYTAVRVSMAEPAAQDTNVTNTVIPHEAELWADFVR